MPFDFAETRAKKNPIALLGYCVESFEAAQKLGYPFVAVVPPGFAELLEKDGIEAITWNFDRINDQSFHLAAQMSERRIRFAVPLYEETVEWAGAINSQLMDNPRLFNRSLLFRDKAMMKRKAQMSGIRVGVFEEVESRGRLHKFFLRVNEALEKLEGDVADPVHIKPLSAAGSVGHRIIRSEEDIESVPDTEFPLLAESHLNGQEFSCEVFVHDGLVRFLNINEYIHIGYSQLLPPTPSLEQHRPRIRQAVQKLVSAFGFRNGVLHPEYFLDAEGELNFGEVASRIPGGHIFELIERAYGFDPFAGQILCADPETTDAELAEFFPDEVEGRKGHAGNVLVYPRQKEIKELRVPAELEDEPYFLKHDLFEPVSQKVLDRTGFGNHYGKVDFFGEDPERLRTLLETYEKADFYV